MSNAGRPTDYKPEYCEQVIELMYNGHSIEEVAYILKISKQTLYNWKEANPEFMDAVKLGTDFAEGWWKINATTNLNNKEFNSTLWYMNMKNRFGWKDRQENNQILIAIDQEDFKKQLNEETKQF